MKIRDILKQKLTEEEMEHLVTSYDIVGDVAIIDVPEEIRHRKDDIADAILTIHKNIHNVCMKKAGREGEYRLNEVELVKGNTTLATCTESGCRIMIDVSKAFYSVRESTERLRIAGMVKPDETIMVLFAGVGPYAIVIGKKNPDVEKIYALEINPDAVKLMKDNIRINKLQTKIVPIPGDAKTDSKPYYGKCDRVIMPLPRTAYEFIEEAFMLMKSEGGIMHLYHVEEEGDISQEVKEELEKISVNTGRKYEIIDKRKVLPFSPGKCKFCIDIKIFV